MKYMSLISGGVVILIIVVLGFTSYSYRNQLMALESKYEHTVGQLSLVTTAYDAQQQVTEEMERKQRVIVQERNKYEIQIRQIRESLQNSSCASLPPSVISLLEHAEARVRSNTSAE